MSEEQGSRRAFIVGGAAAAAIGPLAIAAAAGDSEAPAWSPPAPAAAPASAEVAYWQRYLGVRFRIAGEYGGALGHLVAVVTGTPDPDRPANLKRPVPFTLYFEVEQAIAPVGQKTYSVTRADRKVYDFFLGRGEDRGGKAVFHALFN